MTGALCCVTGAVCMCDWCSVLCACVAGALCCVTGALCCVHVWLVLVLGMAEWMYGGLEECAPGVCP